MTSKEEIEELIRNACEEEWYACKSEIPKTEEGLYDLRELDLDNIHVGGLDFDYCDFSKSKIRRGNFIGCDFFNAKFHQSWFFSCDFVACEFGYSDWKYSMLASISYMQNASIEECSFYEAKLKNTSFKQVDLKTSVFLRTSFNDCNLEKVKIYDCNVRKSTFTGCKFVEVKFEETDHTQISDIPNDLKKQIEIDDIRDAIKKSKSSVDKKKDNG